MFSSLLSPKKAIAPEMEPIQAASPVQENPILAVLRVLVGSLDDSSPDVREAAATALKDNAARHSELVLDCCLMAVKPATKRRGDAGPLAALALQVMAHAIKVGDESMLDTAMMRDVVHVALNEMAATKGLGSPEQGAASDVLVAVGTRVPDIMFEEVLQRLRAGAVPLLAVVHMFADFADVDAAHFVPRVRAVFARVLPALGGVGDQQRVYYAQAFTSWCEAISHYQHDIDPDWKMDGDTRAFIFSAFELFHHYWLRAKESQVRLATIEALGEMSPLIGRKELKKCIHKLLNSLLGSYSREEGNHVIITKAAHNILAAALAGNDGPRLLDYQGLVYTLNTLLPMAASTHSSSHHVSMQLKNLHEALRCFDVVTQAFPDEVCGFLLQRIDSRDEVIKVGTLSLLRHLLPRFADKWHSKKTPLRERLGSLLKEQSLDVRKVLAQVLLVVASSNFLDVENAEPFMDFLVRQSSIDVESSNNEPGKSSQPEAPAMELRTLCEKGLYLLASTAVNAEPYLWPYLLKTLTPPQYTPATSTICRCIAEIARRRAEVIQRDLAVLGSSFPTPQVLLARLIVLLESPLSRGRLGRNIANLLYGLASFFHKNVVLLWREELPKLTAFLEQGEEDWRQEHWEEMVLGFLSESLDVISDQGWTLLLGSAFEEQFKLYSPTSSRYAFCYRCIGTVLQKLTDASYCQHKLEQLYAQADLSKSAHRKSLAMAVGLAAASHLEMVLGLLRKAFAQQKRRLRPFLGFLGFGSSNGPDVEKHFAALALMYGYTAFYAPATALQSRIDALVGTGYFAELLKVDSAPAKYAVISAIDLLGKAVQGAADKGVSFPLKSKEDLLTHVMNLIAGSGWSTEVLELHRQALQAFTTMISVDPPVSSIVRNRLLESVIHLFAAPHEPATIVRPLLSDLVTLLVTMLRSEARDPLAQAELLQLQLSQLDKFVTSSDDDIRERACTAALTLLQEYRGLLSSVTPELDWEQTGACRDALLLGERLAFYLPACTDKSITLRDIAGTIVEELASVASLLVAGKRTSESSSQADEQHTSEPADKFEGPSSGSNVSEESSESLQRRKSSVGSLVQALEQGSVGCPEATDSHTAAEPSQQLSIETETSQTAIEVRDDPVPNGSNADNPDSIRPNAEQSWLKIRDLKGGLASQKDQYKVVAEIVLALCSDLTTEEIVCFLLCAKMRVSPEASLGTACALTEMARCWGGQIGSERIPPIVQNLLACAGAASEDSARDEVLEALCVLAETGHAQTAFRVILEAATDPEEPPKPSMYDRMLRRVNQQERHSLDLLEQVFQAFAQNSQLAYTLCNGLLDQINPLTTKAKDDGKRASDFSPPDAATWALGVVLWPDNAVATVCTSDLYAQTLAALLLRIAPIRRGPPIPILAQDYVTAFEAFCTATSDRKMAAALSSNGPESISVSEQWTDVIDEIVVCMAGNRRSQIAHVCQQLFPALECELEEERIIAAAALSGFVVHVAENEWLLRELVEKLIGHVTDEDRTVRRFCVRGLTQVPSVAASQYAPQVLSSILPLLDDTSEDVIFAVLCGLEPLLTEASSEAVQPHLLTIADALLNLQTRQHTAIRAAAFSSIGFLVRFKEGAPPEFEERSRRNLPRLLFHLEDPAATVRSACRKTVNSLGPSFPGVDLSSSVQSTGKLPLRSVAAQLNQSFSEHTSLYIDVTKIELKSSWPTVRSSAAYFAACLIVEAHDRKVEKSQVADVAASLVNMVNEDPSAEVRLGVASALGILLEYLTRVQ